MIWATLTSGLTTVNSIGKLIVDNLNAAVGSVASSVWGVGSRTITGGTITTVSDKTGYSLTTAPLDAAATRAALGLAAANLDSQLATLATASSVTTIGTNVTAIKAKTDNLPAAPAATSDIPAASAVATAVRTELSTELARIDVATSTRLASASYSAPPSASAIATQVITSMGTGTFLTAIPWNTAWDAEVQSECADALIAYDPPTKAELDAAIAGISGGGSGGGGGSTIMTGSARRNLANTAPLHFTFRLQT